MCLFGRLSIFITIIIIFIIIIIIIIINYVPSYLWQWWTYENGQWKKVDGKPFCDTLDNNYA